MFRAVDDAGFTLVELLVTVTIMSLACHHPRRDRVFMRSTSVQRTSAKLDEATHAERPDFEDTPLRREQLPSPTSWGYNFQVTVTAKCWDGTKGCTGSAYRRDRGRRSSP